MKIIQPSADLLTPIDGIASLQFIEKMARISHRSEDNQTPTSWRIFLNTVVVGHGDWSVTEHAHATVIFRVDRAIAIELRTHRFIYADAESGYTQESTRFVNGRKSYPNGLEFIQPSNIKNPDIFQTACTQAEEHYLDLLDKKERPQEARSVLPNAVAATIAYSANFRAWRGFLLARTTIESHPDMKRVTIPLLRQFQERIPLLYDDIEVGLKQSLSMGKVH